MGKKLNLLIGFGAGYLLGSRAGRERYEQIVRVAAAVRGAPVVKAPMDAASAKVSQVVREQGEKVTDKVAEEVKKRLFEPRESNEP